MRTKKRDGGPGATDTVKLEPKRAGELVTCCHEFEAGKFVAEYSPKFVAQLGHVKTNWPPGFAMERAGTGEVFTV
jgi:hypothetical protein